MAELIFVGTSSGKTVSERFHSSLFFRTDDYGLLVDAGDGISKALLNAGIGFDELDGVIITHTHADHIAGIASLVTQMIIDEREKDFEIFVYEKYRERLVDYLNLTLLFPETFSFDLRINGFQFDEEILISESLSVFARQNSHILNKRNIKTDFPFASASVVINAGNSNVVYTSDVGSPEDLTLFDDMKYDVFISECEHIKPEDVLVFALNKNSVSFFVTHYTNEEETLKAFDESKIKVANDKLRIGLN